MLKFFKLFIVVAVAHLQASVTVITGPEHFEQFQHNNPQRVILFYLPTCPHCQAFQPAFAQVTETPQLQHVTFATVDLSNKANKPIGKKYQIREVPRVFIERASESIASTTDAVMHSAPGLVREILSILPLPSTAREIATQATITDKLTYPFSLPKIAYGYGDLEPYMDTKTMQLHHDQHHATYVNNLNKALQDYPELHQLSLQELVTKGTKLPKKAQKAITNNGGGHYNHSFFWTILQPAPASKPSEQLMRQITKQFGSLTKFQEQFTTAALGVFGSGWTWLVANKRGQLTIITTHDQVCPTFATQKPILCLDLWEHAYYLLHQNRRAEYIKAWWNIVNWEQVSTYYAQAVG